MKLSTQSFFQKARPGDFLVSVARTQPKNAVAKCQGTWSTVNPSEKLLSSFKAGPKDAKARANYSRVYKGMLTRNADRIHAEFQRLVALAGMRGYQRIVLVCWEKPGDFCHRELLRAWLVEWFAEILPGTKLTGVVRRNHPDGSTTLAISL